MLLLPDESSDSLDGADLTAGIVLICVWLRLWLKRRGGGRRTCQTRHVTKHVLRDRTCSAPKLVQDFRFANLTIIETLFEALRRNSIDVGIAEK